MKQKIFTLALMALSLTAFSQKNVIETNSYLRNSTNSGWEHESKANHYYHNNDDSVVTYSKARNPDTGILDNLHQESFIYGTDRRIESNVIKHWEGFNNVSGDYKNESRLQNTYASISTTGGLKTIRSLSVTESWSKSGSNWDTSNVVKSKPDIDGYIQSTTTQFRFGGNLINLNKSDFSYDGNGKVTQELFYTWVNDNWMEKSKKVVTYVAGTDRIDHATYYSYDTMAKTFSVRLSVTRYTYDMNNSTDSLLHSVWDAASSSYIPQTLALYSYDADGDVTEELLQVYNTTNKAWDYFRSTTYLYEDKSGINGLVSAQLKVYPVPADNGFTIKSSSIQEAILYYMDGRIAKQYAPSSTDLRPYISTVNLNAGTYFLEVTQTDKRKLYKKILINH